MSDQSEAARKLVEESESAQNFLKAVYHLQQDLASHEPKPRRVSTSALAEVLHISAPSVTDMAQRLGKAGLVDYRRHKGTLLTPLGKQEAIKIIRRHRLIESYLVEELGYEPYEVHEEAERMEHTASDRFVEAIAHKLGDPDFDPHGDPIPSADGSIQRRDLKPLADIPLNTPATVARYGTNEAALLRHILERGFDLETHVQVVAHDPLDGPVRVLIGREECIIGHKIAKLILVELLP
ncbi:MAG: metal-dependent transcriptional regulator [Anaerolineae bacterium]|nr:metal-dependent transcriptional regulator [Anaerolineae bacterium]